MSDKDKIKKLTRENEELRQKNERLEWAHKQSQDLRVILQAEHKTIWDAYRVLCSSLGNGGAK